MTENRLQPHFTLDLEHSIREIQLLLGSLAPNGELPLAHEGRLAELQQMLNQLPVADLAFILESLPPEQRLPVWHHIQPGLDGKILLKVSEPVREILINMLGHDELRAIIEQLDISEIADLAHHLPQSMTRELFKSRELEKREQLRAAMSYPADTVGALMDFKVVTIRQEATVESVLRFLRRLDELPGQTDQLFVVDRDGVFFGVLPLSLLLVSEPETEVASLKQSGLLTLHPDDSAQLAAQAFQRYALTSLPVIDDDRKLLGRLSAAAVVNYNNTVTEKNIFHLAGLQDKEDIYASLLKIARNRWMWISLNLCLAFIASRIIGHFELLIEKFTALAALMPIVAGLAASSANQTLTVASHALKHGQLSEINIREVLRKELTLSLLNGAVWGGIAGIFSYLLYKSFALGLLLTVSASLNLLLGTALGIILPLALKKAGQDPAYGSGILLSAITTSGGFFIFLWLASMFLPR